MSSKSSKSTLNLHAKTLAEEILEQPGYLDNLKFRARTGALHPSLEKMLWEYRFGKVIDRTQVAVTGAEDLLEEVGEMTAEELAREVASLAHQVLVSEEEEAAFEEQRRAEWHAKFAKEEPVPGTH